MRLAGFEPATHGLEGRRSSAELQAPVGSPRVQAPSGVYGAAMSEATLQTNHGPIRIELFPEELVSTELIPKAVVMQSVAISATNATP